MRPKAIRSRSDKAFMTLVLAIVCFISARTHADPDLWGHVRFGQDILSSGIPATDSYSYLGGDQPWINHELLAEVSYGAAFSALGVPGLVLLKIGIVFATIGLIYRRLMRQGLHPLRAGMVIVVILMLMSVGLWTIRPQLFTYLFFLLTLLLIDAADAGSRSALWALPVVLLVWTNSHGGFLAGLGLVFVWVAATILLRRLTPAVVAPFRSTTLAGVAVACGIATLLNPYGAKLLVFLLRTATVARPEIGEWQPIAIGSPEGIAYLVAIAVSVIAVLRSERARRPALLAVFVVTALLPMQALRHVPLFGLSFGVLIGNHLAGTWNRWSPSKPPQGVLPPLAALAGAALFLAAAVPHVACIRIDPTFIRFPARAVAAMKDARVQGNVATFFDWGEYIIWHLGPGVRVSVDGRRETVYSPESYARSLRFMYGIGKWDEIVDDPHTDMTLVGRDQPTYNLMRMKSGWQLVHEDSLSALFARTGSSQATALLKVTPSDLPPDGAGLCFP